MTGGRVAPLEPVEKGADADPVRELPAFAAERLVAAEVDRLTGAAAGARTPDRTDHRERGWVARAGRIGPAVPKPREGSHFPAFPGPRRTAEEAPTAVVREAGACPPARAAGPGGPRRPDPLGRRPGRGDGRHRHLDGPPPEEWRVR